MSLFKKTNPELKEEKPKGRKVSGHVVDTRNKKLKTFSITATILFIAIVLIFNVVFDNLLGGVLKWDWSTGGQYTIGDVSEEILNSMAKDIQIIGLFEKDSNSNYLDVQLMLDSYVKKSNGHVTVRYVDPDKYPSIKTEIDPQGYVDLASGNFAVYCAETKKTKQLSQSDIFDIQYDQTTYEQYIAGVTAEQSFTGAIKYVMSETTPVIYFTSGHDELDYASNYSFLVKIMKNNNFDVKSLDMLGLEEIPADCASLILAAPAKDISTAERKLIGNYLKKGGSLMVITDYSNSSYPELNALLVDYNLEISNNKIREGNSDYRFQDDPYYLRANAPSCTITEEAYDRLTLAENVRGINQLSITKDWITVEQVLTTSEEGYAETNGDASQSSAAGVQNVALLSENKGWIDNENVKNSAKVLIFGSSSIFSDSVVQASSQIYNAYLFYYGIQWLSNAQADNSLYIEAKVPTSYTVTKGSNTTYVLAAVVVLLILPGALLLAALIVFRKRKHL